MWQVTFHINASNFWTRHLIPLSHLDLRNMRRLFLHVSPLSDAEYNLYVADLMELSFTDRSAAMRQDEDYERVIIGVREVRFRGRYRSVTVADVDMIIRYFSPTIQKTDTLCGGEFFAAIRLVIHAFEGKHINRDLVFVQAKPRALVYHARRFCLNQTESSPRDLCATSTPSAFYPAKVSRREERQDYNAVGSSSTNKIIKNIVSGAYIFAGANVTDSGMVLRLLLLCKNSVHVTPQA